jgi:hypothetical protein
MRFLGCSRSVMAGLLLVLVAACSGSGTATIDGSIADASLVVDSPVAVDAQDAPPSPPTVPTTMTYVKASNDAGHFGVVALSGDGNTFVVGAPSESSAATGIDGDQTDTSMPFSGAAYVFVRSGTTWVQQAYLKAANSTGNTNFGASLGISADGNTLVVGARFENSGAIASGAAYVFTRSGTTWMQQAFLKAPDADYLDDFGNALRLSSDGQTLVVGARGESSASTVINGDQADDSASGAGAAYVFARSGATWSLQAYLKASNTRAAAGFGRSVTMSANGNVVAVGAVAETSGATGVDGNQATANVFGAGAAYVFTRSATTWSQTAYLKASNTRPSSNFGWAIALSGDASTLAIAASQESSAATGINGNQSDQNAGSAGAVYVFTYNGATWAQQAYVKASNTDVGDFFGESIAVSGTGDRLLVGAGGEDSAAMGFGGDQQDNSLYLAGAAYLFGRTGATWSQLQYVKAINPQSNASFGSSYDGNNVTMSSNGGVYAIGAVFERSSNHGVGTTPDNSFGNTGAVYVLE